MTKWIKIALYLVIIVTVVHDAGLFLIAGYRIDDRTRSIAFAAAQTAKTNPASQSAWPAVATAAQESGLEVLAYQQSPAGVTIQTRIAVPGTWAIGPALALWQRKPMSTPLTLERTVTSTG